MLSLEATPRDASVFMTTALQLPSFGSHSSVCSPGPLVEATQKSWSPRGDAGASPARFEYSGFFPMSVTMERSTPFNYPSTSVAVAIPTKTSRSLSLRMRTLPRMARARSEPPKSTSALSETTEGPRISAATAEGAGVLAAREGLVRDRDTGDCSSVDCITRGPAVVSDTRHRRTRLVGGVVVVARWRRGDSCARRRGGCPGRGTRGCRRGLENSATASWVLAWSRRARARRRLEPARPSPSLARRGAVASGHTSPADPNPWLCV